MQKAITLSFICLSFILMHIADRYQATKKIDLSQLEAAVQPAPCLEVFKAIEKHSAQYDIPRKYAYAIAFEETRYLGPFHWEYSPGQTSSAGAVGPMQVMYGTARGLFPELEFSRDDLKTNIDLNVECSMKLLRELHNRYGDWKKVFGAYNTGKPIINSYALRVYQKTKIK